MSQADASSTPSATATSPSAWARSMVDRTISPSFFFEGISVTNVLSILSSSIGSRFRLVRDENPAPERPDQPRLLRQRNEPIRRQQPTPGMRPAHQGFDPDNLARPAAKYRLIVKDQRVFFDRAPKLEGKREAAGIDVVLEGVEGGPGARPLGFVHGRVATSKQGVRILRMPGKQDDPDAGSNLEQLALDHQGLLQGLLDSRGGQARCHLVRYSWENDGELVAAETGHRVRLPQLALESAGHVAKDLVTTVVPKPGGDIL